MKISGLSQLRKSVNGGAQIHTWAYLALDQAAKGALNPAILPTNKCISNPNPRKLISQTYPSCLLKALLLPLTHFLY